MKKSATMFHIVQEYGARLSTANASYSKINKSKEVGWYNFHISKFSDDLHMLLYTDTELILSI